MAQRGRPRSRIVVETPTPKRGRPAGKPCATEGCKNKVRPGFRYCGFCGGRIIAGLRSSPDYWKEGQPLTEDRDGDSATMSLD